MEFGTFSFTILGGYKKFLDPHTLTILGGIKKVFRPPQNLQTKHKKWDFLCNRSSYKKKVYISW